jgi:hypothetical protein
VLPALETPAETLWVDMRRETGRGKDRFKIRDLSADERCSQTILDFLPTTDVGRLAQSLQRKTPRARYRSGIPGSGMKGKRSRKSPFNWAFLCIFFGALYLSQEARTEGKGRATTSRKDSGWKRTVCISML